MKILPWQKLNWNILSKYRAQNRVPQALLLIGKKGLGKQYLAIQLAFSLLCEKPKDNGIACGYCNSCLLLNAETHPDFIQIKPDGQGKSITIGQMRNLITRLALKPQFQSYRVVVVNPADAMNNAAINAFLKCLEEPPERTVILLITDKPSLLPSTIVSRCQKLVIALSSKEIVFTWLKQMGIEHNLELIFNLALGAPFLALDYAKNGTLEMRNSCFKAWMDVAKQRRHPVSVAEDWYKLPDELLTFWMLGWITDTIKCCYQMKADSLVNSDLKEALQEQSQQLASKELYKLYDLMLISQQRFNTQLNKQAMFEDILIKWSELNMSKRL
jgi:DNA polymerase III subunit delta'